MRMNKKWEWLLYNSKEHSALWQ